MSEPLRVDVAALYVDPRGSYSNLPGVDLWDEARDGGCFAAALAAVRAFGGVIAL